MPVESGMRHPLFEIRVSATAAEIEEIAKLLPGYTFSGLKGPFQPDGIYRGYFIKSPGGAKE